MLRSWGFQFGWIQASIGGMRSSSSLYHNPPSRASNSSLSTYPDGASVGYPPTGEISSTPLGFTTDQGSPRGIFQGGLWPYKCAMPQFQRHEQVNVPPILLLAFAIEFKYPPEVVLVEIATH